MASGMVIYREVKLKDLFDLCVDCLRERKNPVLQ